MTPEQRARLQHLRWLCIARSLRSSKSQVIAEAIGVSPSSIEFTDEEETRRISEILSAQMNRCDDIEFPNHQAAIDFATKSLSGITGPAYLFDHECHMCGFVVIDFATALKYIDALLKSGYYGLISADGKAGVIIFCQEDNEWYVNLWRHE
jgi:hypothetical protein